MPPSLDALRECVEAITAALEREVVYKGEPPIVTFCNHHGAYLQCQRATKEVSRDH